MELKAESRMERKKEATQNKIITAAVQLFTQHGLDVVTMESIAETVDIAKGTLYNYFPSKEAIINAYLQRTFQERQAERIEQLRQLPDTRSRLTYLLNALTQGVQAQPQIFETYLVYRMKQVLSLQKVEGEESGLSGLVREIIILGLQGQDLRSDVPEDLLEDLFEFILIEAFKPLYLEADHFDPQESIQRSVDLFMKGAGA